LIRHDPGSEVSPRPSLRELFDEYGQFVWRTVRYLGIREADIEDVCQEVFLTVHRKLSGFEGRSSIRTWLYGICLRVASDHRRRAHVRRELPASAPPAPGVGGDQDEEVARKQARARLGSILDQLDDDKRAVFVLYEIEELTMKQVARIVGCPLQTAYSRLHAARSKVVALIMQLHETERECP
jgi:RNA polymerase sigma-70 factor (ECF subfamily)